MERVTRMMHLRCLYNVANIGLRDRNTKLSVVQADASCPLTEQRSDVAYTSYGRNGYLGVAIRARVVHPAERLVYSQPVSEH
jgi:hypothetical protein